MKQIAPKMVFVSNNSRIASSSIPVLPLAEFGQTLTAAIHTTGRILALTVWPGAVNRCQCVLAAVAFSDRALIGLMATPIPEVWPALTPECPALNWFERELAEQWLVPVTGHPWLKPIRFQPPLQPQVAQTNTPQVGVTSFLEWTGQAGHEVAVGPVHAGIIEPGHFRFLCYGETVHHLEISLGYQHRGVEQAMVGAPGNRSLHYMETLAGDTSIGHSLAYCQLVEALTGVSVSPRADLIRAIALELERLANHIGDLGAICGDVGYLPTMNYCGRIRGDVLNMTAEICGNRFGRGLNQPGGVAWDLEPGRIADLQRRLKSIHQDVTSAVELMFDRPSVLARLESTGILTRDTAQDLGLVGVAARACGLERDVRCEFPYGAYRLHQIPLITWHGGDCFARAYVRWQEIQKICEFVRQQLGSMASGPLGCAVPELPPDNLAISLVEAWRGEICHLAATTSDSKWSFYKVVDPSFHNWFGLAMAMRGQQISDFPLCNKSFNLSYCGHDL